MAISIEVLTPASGLTQSTGQASAIEIVRQTQAPVSTNTGAAVVEVVGSPVLKNVVVSAVEPNDPYEGQIWVDIS